MSDLYDLCLAASFANERSKLRDTSVPATERSDDIALKLARSDASALVEAMEREGKGDV